MGSSKRIKTPYPGVFYRIAERKGHKGEEKVFYIVFKQDGKIIEEKVGRQFEDAMTPAKAAGIRAERIERKRLSRKEIRAAKEQESLAQKQILTVEKLWLIYKEKNATKKSLKNDISNYNRYISRFSNSAITELRTADIEGLSKNLFSIGLKAQTIKLALGLLKAMINFGVKNGLCKMPDPSILFFEMPKVDNQKTEMLTNQQLQNIFQALDDEPDQRAASFMRLAIVTGMRKGALMALRWDDLDFEQGFITLSGEAAKKGKTERIPMSQSAKRILRNIEKDDSPFVFPGRWGGQRKEFYKIALRVKKKAGLPEDFRPLHGLRHAYASFLASSGQVDLYTLQKLLTHSSPQMTQRYAHLADEALHRAANVADSIIRMDEDSVKNENGNEE